MHSHDLTHISAPTQFFPSGRGFASLIAARTDTGVPLRFMPHFRAGCTLGPRGHGWICRKPPVSCSTMPVSPVRLAKLPKPLTAMLSTRADFVGALGFSTVDVLGFSSRLIAQARSLQHPAFSGALSWWAPPRGGAPA